jgi:hypothetical protein
MASFTLYDTDETATAAAAVKSVATAGAVTAGVATTAGAVKPAPAVISGAGAALLRECTYPSMHLIKWIRKQQQLQQ